MEPIASFGFVVLSRIDLRGRLPRAPSSSPSGRRLPQVGLDNPSQVSEGWGPGKFRSSRPGTIPKPLSLLIKATMAILFRGTPIANAVEPGFALQ